LQDHLVEVHNLNLRLVLVLRIYKQLYQHLAMKMSRQLQTTYLNFISNY